MDSIEKIKISKKNLEDEISKEMDSLVDYFKSYVTVDHVKYSKYQIIEGICTKINYGIIKNDYPNYPIFDSKEDNNYYCFLPEKIKFYNKYTHSEWYTNLIVYNDKLNYWFIYNVIADKSVFGEDHMCLKEIEEDKVIEFTSLDIETQISFLEQLKNLLK